MDGKDQEFLPGVVVNRLARVNQDFSDSSFPDTKQPLETPKDKSFFKVLCSYGGIILPRPGDGRLLYVGGHTKVMVLSKNLSYLELLDFFQKITGHHVTVRYQLPYMDMDTLILVASNDDVQLMIEEFEDMEIRSNRFRLRIFLFDENKQFENFQGISDANIQYNKFVEAINFWSEANAIPDGYTCSNTGSAYDSPRFHVPNESSLAADGKTNGQMNYSMGRNPSHSNLSYIGDLRKEPGAAISSVFGQGSQPIDSIPPAPSGNDRFPFMEALPATEQRRDETAKVAAVTLLSNLNPTSAFLDSSAEPNEDVTVPGLHPLAQGGAINQRAAQETLTGYGIKSQSTDVEFLSSLSPVTLSQTAQPPGYSEAAIPNIQSFQDAERFSKYQASNLGLPYLKTKALAEPSGVGLRGYAAPVPRNPIHAAPHLNESYQVDRRIGSPDTCQSPSAQAAIANNSFSLSPFANNHEQTPTRPSAVRKEDFVPGAEPGSSNLTLKMRHNSAADNSTHFGVIREDKVFPVLDFDLGRQVQVASKIPAQQQLENKIDPMIWSGDILSLREGKEAENSLQRESKAIASAIRDREVAGKAGLRQSSSSISASDEGSHDDSGLLRVGYTVSSSEQESIPDLIQWESMKAEGGDEVSAGVLEFKQGVQLGKEPGVNNGDGKLPKLLLLKDRDSLPQSPRLVREKSGADFQSPRFDSSKTEGISEFKTFEQVMEDNLENFANANAVVSVDFMDETGQNLYSLSGAPKGDSSPLELETGTPKKGAGLAETVQESNPKKDGSEVPDNNQQAGKTSGEGNIEAAVTVEEAAQIAISGGLQTIENSDLEELKQLGVGTYGAVFHGKWRGTDVAIKRIKSSVFQGHDKEKLAADFWREACTLAGLHHPNVVAFYGVVRAGDDGSLATVTEFMVNGSLKQVMQKKDKSIDRRKRILLAMDAAFGMEYLHSKNIIHFDLKCDNLLVNLRDPVRPVCKVGDLGLSRVKHSSLVSGEIRGTLPWMAPELLDPEKTRVSEKVDVFSFGICLWEMLTGEDPYTDLHHGAIIGGIMNNSLRPEIPVWCDPQWKSLMERCWSHDSEKRPSFQEIADELRTMAEATQPNRT